MLDDQPAAVEEEKSDDEAIDHWPLQTLSSTLQFINVCDDLI